MTALVWDEVGSRAYENGLDRGVLYLPDETAVPWNGLVEIKEKAKSETNPVFFEGAKINDLVTPGPFSGTMKAITYPPEFEELDGLGRVTEGLFVGEQKPKLFGLSYRSLVGTDLDADAGYKIHILYNVTAIPNDKTYATLTDDPNVSVFEWDISAIPEEIPGFRPTAHVILDSRAINAEQLAEYEDILYGTSSTSASMIPLIDFVNGLYYGYKWKIINNGDGTWTAITPIEGLLEFDPVDPDLFTLEDVNAVYLTPDLYKIDDSFV